MTPYQVGDGILANIMKKAMEETGWGLGKLTVLSGTTDPYRLDIPPKQADAKWFADRFNELVEEDETVHLRGLHYRIVSRKNVPRLPDGRVYKNDADSWDWLGFAAKYARMLGHVPFDRITDERNEAPETFLGDSGVARIVLRPGTTVDLPQENWMAPKVLLRRTRYSAL